MITVNCPKCGGAADIDEKREESVICKHCKSIITLEKAAPEKYKELMEAREKQEQRYKNILKEYENGNDALLKNAMHKVISRTDTEDFNINRWFDFIFDAVNIGIKKKDTTNLEILKAHARKFDDAFSDYNASDRRLYDSMVFLHPEILNDSEWKVEFEKASADKADVQLLKNNILKCVKEKKEPKLLISVLNVLSASQEEFKNIGEEFLNSILDDEDIAKILSVSFFKKARGGNFAKKLKKYVSSTFKEAEVILKDTLVWNNAEKVQKQRKNQKIIILSSVLGVIAITALSIFLFRNATVKDSIKLEKPSGNAIIKMVYSESPDLTGYTVIFKKNDGTEERVQVTPDMLSGYDKEKIGTQAAKITYKGKTFDVNIEVVAKQLEKTTASISDNKLIWDRVANAEGYYIYLSKSSTASGEAKYATLEDKQGNAALVFDLTSVDNMGNEFYATVVAYNTTDKYSDSERADAIKVTKLSAATNVVYNKESGKLTWTAVEGADHYTVEINGETVPNVTANEQSLTLKLGDNSISITAHPTEQSVIMSKTGVNIHKLSPVLSASYSGDTVKWEANSQSNLYNIYRNDVPVAEKNSGKAFDVSSWEPGLYTVKIEVASNSLEKVTSEPAEFKIYVGTRIAVSGGTINWSSLGGTSYDIYVNGVKLDASSTTEKYKNISDFATAAGDYKVYVIVDDSGISETITVTKLKAPTLTVKNQNLTATNYTEIYVDGALFSGAIDGLLKSLTTPKEYVISAINKATEDNQIDSDTASVTVTKLEAPTIAVVNGAFYANGNAVSTGTAYTWYVDNVERELSAITAGTYEVYAKLKASADNELDSATSNVITVTKLPTPVLNYEKTPIRKLTCTPETVEGGSLKYYKNGEEWNVDLNNLSGVSEITARFVASAENVLSSELSAAVSIVTTNVTLTLQDGSSKVTAILREADTGLYYSFTFTWYNGDTQVGNPAEYGKTQFTGTTANRASSKPNGANKVVVTATIYDAQGSTVDVLTQTFTF